MLENVIKIRYRYRYRLYLQIVVYFRYSPALEST